MSDDYYNSITEAQLKAFILLRYQSYISSAKSHNICKCLFSAKDCIVTANQPHRFIENICDTWKGYPGTPSSPRAGLCLQDNYNFHFSVSSPNNLSPDSVALLPDTQNDIELHSQYMSECHYFTRHVNYSITTLPRSFELIILRCKSNITLKNSHIALLNWGQNSYCVQLFVVNHKYKNI